MPVTVDVLRELLSEAEAARAAAEAEVDALRSEESAFRAALQRRLQGPNPPAPTQPDHSPATSVVSKVEFQPRGDDWSSVARTVAVEQAIADITVNGGYASPPEIEQCLANHGRNDNRDEIGGAIAHLNRTGRIHRVARAQWAGGSEPEKTSEGTAPTVPSEEDVPTSEERRTDDEEGSDDHDHVPRWHNGDGGNPPSLAE